MTREKTLIIHQTFRKTLIKYNEHTLTVHTPTIGTSETRRGLKHPLLSLIFVTAKHGGLDHSPRFPIYSWQTLNMSDWRSWGWKAINDTERTLTTNASIIHVNATVKGLKHLPWLPLPSWWLLEGKRWLTARMENDYDYQTKIRKLSLPLLTMRRCLEQPPKNVNPSSDTRGGRMSAAPRLEMATRRVRIYDTGRQVLTFKTEK